MADVFFYAALGLAGAALVLAFVRFLLGPTLADRTVALDGMTVISLPVIAWMAAYSGRIIYLDVALVYGLISFVGVVAMARYLERGLA